MPIRVNSGLFQLRSQRILESGSGEFAGGTEATFGLWMYIDGSLTWDGTFKELIRFGRASYFRFGNSTNRYQFRTQLDTGSTATSNVSVDCVADSWNFLLYRIQSGTQEVYLNGVLAGSASETFASFDTSTTTNYMNGPILVQGAQTGVTAGYVIFNGFFAINKYVTDVERDGLYSGAIKPQNVGTVNYVIPMDNESPSSVAVTDEDLQNIGTTSESYQPQAADYSAGTVVRVSGNQHQWRSSGSSGVVTPTSDSRNINFYRNHLSTINHLRQI